MVKTMKYILQATAISGTFDKTLDPQFVPPGARLEYVTMRFDKVAVRVKKWVIDISTIEELNKLSGFAAFHYGAHSHREALIIYRDDECDLPIIEFYNDYHE